jgi:radical SAM superfamily enzyme YgiQ (UPF0313 family)
LNWSFVREARRILELEDGTIYKDWGGKLPIALVYPNTYHVGMSNLGLQTVYRLFNEQFGVVCERVFHNTGPISLESQRPLAEFAVLAFSISFEMDYFNVVEILRLAGIPLSAEERDETYPLLIAGGAAVTANPKPLSPVFDAFAIGEGEAIIPPLVEVLREVIGEQKDEILNALALVPGVYVPALGTATKRQWIYDLDAYPTTSFVLTPNTEFGEMYLIEVARGCGRGCRFCLAGYIYRPMRERSLEVLLKQAEEGLRCREEVGLLGAAVSCYKHIDELALELRKRGAKISISSLRVDFLTEALVRALAESGARTLTIAPEAGSEGLRISINKRIPEEDVFRAADMASRYGFAQLKLYFMIGLPGESEEDIKALLEMVSAVRGRFHRRIVVQITPFVPKAHTPFQWVAMTPEGILWERLRYIERNLRAKGVSVKFESPSWAAVQGVLARGDEKVGRALMNIRKRSLAVWRRAMRECGLEESDYLKERPLDEQLPWSVVKSGVESAYLKEELRKALVGESTEPCKPKICTKCGACSA